MFDNMHIFVAICFKQFSMIKHFQEKWIKMCSIIRGNNIHLLQLAITIDLLPLIKLNQYKSNLIHVFAAFPLKYSK